MKERKNGSSVRGVSVRHVSLGIMALSVLLYAALLVVSFRAAGEFNDMKSATDLYISCQEDAALVSTGSDYLTEQVRMFAFTKDRKYMENYFHEINVDRRRDRAMEQLGEKAGETARTYLSQALDWSNQLTDLEIYAMRLTAEAENITDLPPELESVELYPGHKAMSRAEKIELAQDRVFGDEYQAKKALINENVEAFISDVISNTQHRQEVSIDDLGRAMTTQRIVFSVLLLMNVVVFIMISMLIIKPLKVYIQCIKEDKRMEITGAYEFKYLALTYNDIYELNAANEMLLRHQAEHDPLTGILNRGAFDQAKKLLQLKPRPIALLLIDVDKFKQINDGWGHDAGDKVLKKVAGMLEEHFRTSDIPARIGGDEFAVILDETSHEKEEALRQKILEMNRQLSSPKDGLPPVTLSVGGAFSEMGFSDDLYRMADAALYAVKENGRNGCRFYENGMNLPGKD